MSRLSRSFRLLPVLLVASSVLLTMKLFAVANGVDRFLTSGLAVAAAHAETAKPERAPAKPAHTETKPVEHALANGTATASVPGAATPVPDKPSADQLPVPTQQELQVLQSLAQRREALDQRAQDLDRRTDLLQAAEARIDRKLVEMKDMESTLLRLIKTHDEQQEAKIRSLVKIYENMKPRDASRIFEELDMDTLLPVVERMNERKLAPVLASMNPLRAKTITEELARLRQLASQNSPGKSG